MNLESQNDVSVNNSNINSNNQKTISFSSFISSINTVIVNNTDFNCISILKESHEFNVYLLNKKELNKRGVNIEWHDLIDTINKIIETNDNILYNLIPYHIIYRKVFSIVANNKINNIQYDNKIKTKHKFVDNTKYIPT